MNSRLLAAALLLIGLAAQAAEPVEFPSPASVTKASDLRGRIVETRDGQELGRIEDYALDLASGRIAYVVVSVGSFLIEDSLIAVAPDALRDPGGEDGRLVLEADAATLRDAPRFSRAGDWPVRADVLAQGSAGAASEPGAASEHDAAGEPARGTATISDGSRTATLSAGERRIRITGEPRKAEAEADEPTAQEADDGAVPASRFERLDADGDGLLNRAEIAHELRRSDSYNEIDRDGDGFVDEAEFDALQQRRAASEAASEEQAASD